MGGDAPAGLAPGLIIFVTQLSTFVLIGLWHGVTWNFVLWGVWHGVGLFAQNRWSEAMRPRYAALDSRPRLHQAVTLLSTCLTFLYVSLGWVFFALPDPPCPSACWEGCLVFKRGYDRVCVNPLLKILLLD